MDNNYRVSHTEVGKGRSYDASFKESEYRQFIMNWEESVLLNIVSGISNKENYLDFACGTGRILKIAHGMFNYSFGIDVSESMISEAKKKMIKSTFILQDITKDNPFEKEQMDLITSFRFFLNAEPELRESVLRELNPVLKKDGKLVFNIHNNKTILTGIIDFAVFLKKRMQGKVFIPQKSISIKEVRRLLLVSGFEIKTIHHTSIIPIRDESTKFNIFRFSKIEHFFSKIGIAKYFSRYLIFVCHKIVKS